MTKDIGRVPDGTGLSQAEPSGLGPSGFDPSRFRLRRVFNGTMTRGWQVLRDDSPISELFDEHEDAVAALNEFRTDEAIATEAGTAETTEIGSVHEGAGPQDIAQHTTGDA